MLQSDLERLPGSRDSPPSPSGCRGANKSRTASARPAPLLRPLPQRPPPPRRKVSGGLGSLAWLGWSRAQEGPIHSAGFCWRLAGRAAQADRVHGNPRDLGRRQALGEHLTLSLFAPAERKRERSLHRLPPKSSSRAAQKSARCSPAPSSPAPPLWCVAHAGLGTEGRMSWPGRPRCRTGHLRAGHTALSGYLSLAPQPLCPFFLFLLFLGLLTLLLPSYGIEEPPRPSCQAPLGVGQTLLPPSSWSGSLPHPLHHPVGSGPGGGWGAEGEGGRLPGPSSPPARSPLQICRSNSLLQREGLCLSPCGRRQVVQEPGVFLPAFGMLFP